MAKVFQTFRERKGDDGSRVPVLDAKGKPAAHPKWRAVIVEWTGKRKTVTLSKSRVESQQQADLLQGKHDAIRNGLAPAPTPTSRAARLAFADVLAEYLEWGNACGGRGGRPWSEAHAANRTSHLHWWRKELKLKTLADLDGCLPKVERALRALKETGRQGRKRGCGEPLSGKSLNDTAEALRSFCNWAAHKSRRYLAANPVDGFTRYDDKPVMRRRAITPEEIALILDASPEWFALLVEVALVTGFRRAELMALTPGHVEAKNNTLRLDADMDKARKERHQPIPADLAERLLAFAASGEAKALYAKHYRGKAPGEKPTRCEDTGRTAVVCAAAYGAYLGGGLRKGGRGSRTKAS